LNFNLEILILFISVKIENFAVYWDSESICCKENLKVMDEKIRTEMDKILEINPKNNRKKYIIAPVELSFEVEINTKFKENKFESPFLNINMKMGLFLNLYSFIYLYLFIVPRFFICEDFKRTYSTIHCCPS
jgi:hypothetical protein